MSETNILTVDFDWIMEPSIEFYNCLCNSTIPLDNILKNSPGVTIKPDYNKYLLLTIYLNNIVETIADPNRVKFGTDHHEVVDLIKNEWKIKDNYNIFNIDHHHDCGYGKISSLSDIDEQGLACGNWIAYCDKLKEYTWINNKNSDTVIIDEVFKRFRKATFSNDIHIIDYIKFDYVFICVSPGWVPSELFPLYDSLKFSVEKSFDLRTIKNDDIIHSP